jgi:hypothetical protein
MDITIGISCLAEDFRIVDEIACSLNNPTLEKTWLKLTTGMSIEQEQNRNPFEYHMKNLDTRRSFEVIR